MRLGERIEASVVNAFCERSDLCDDLRGLQQDRSGEGDEQRESGGERGELGHCGVHLLVRL